MKRRVIPGVAGTVRKVIPDSREILEPLLGRGTWGPRPGSPGRYSHRLDLSELLLAICMMAAYEHAKTQIGWAIDELLQSRGH